MKLYELTESYVKLMDLEGDFESALGVIDDEIEVKADNIAKVIKELEGDSLKFKEEIDRLSSIRKSTENRISDLKSYLEFNMKRVNKTKFKTDLFSFNIQKNRGSVKVLDENKVPEKYLVHKTSVDKTKIYQDLKDGIDVEGVVLQESESLRIRWWKLLRQVI